MTTLVELAGAALALCTSVAAGTVAHELSHALVLRAAGLSCEIRWRPGRTDGWSPRGAWASVTPRVGGAASPRALRVAALAPLALATPLGLALAGLLPDPFRNGPLVLQAALIGWLGCALPSPQDFAVVWYAERAVAAAAGDERRAADRGETADRASTDPAESG